MDKKRHHFVPVAYLRYFCDEDGKICVYIKDRPNKVIRQAPENVAFHKYYYSQPLPDGGRDNNTLEDLFSDLEGKWPRIADCLIQRTDLGDLIGDLFTFIALQRVRVPASRDACELRLAEVLKSTLRVMDAAGQLPPKPEGYEDILDHVKVAIDPHMSIHAMQHILKEIGGLFDQMEIGALHNMTDIPLLTSDNPVIWFDPSVPESKMHPYFLQPGGPAVLIFPVTPKLMIYGDSAIRGPFERFGFRHAELSDRKKVKVINRHICRFAYNTVFAMRSGHERLISKYADVSPVVQTSTIPVGQGEYVVSKFVFGRRKPKPRWVDRRKSGRHR